MALSTNVQHQAIQIRGDKTRHRSWCRLELGDSRSAIRSEPARRSLYLGGNPRYWLVLDQVFSKGVEARHVWNGTVGATTFTTSRRTEAVVGAIDAWDDLPRWNLHPRIASLSRSRLCNVPSLAPLRRDTKRRYAASEGMGSGLPSAAFRAWFREVTDPQGLTLKRTCKRRRAQTVHLASGFPVYHGAKGWGPDLSFSGPTAKSLNRPSLWRSKTRAGVLSMAG